MSELSNAGTNLRDIVLVLKALLIHLGAVIGGPLLVLAVTYALSRFFSGHMHAALRRANFQPNASILLSRALWAAIWAFGIFFILITFHISTPLAAFIGVLGLAASLSLQQVLQNLVAGVYLLAERPFAINDIVAVVGPNGLNHEGQVEDIQMRTTHLRSRDNELILIPNATVFAGVITNRTAIGGYATQIAVTFPRTSDPDEVERQVREVLAGVPTVLAAPLPELHVDTVGEETWTGNLTFWASGRGTRSRVIWALARAFSEATINQGATA